MFATKEFSSSSVSSSPTKSTTDEANNSSNAFVTLPAVVLQKIVRLLSFEEMSRSRQVCKKMKYHCEHELNEGFFQLGRKVSGSTAKLKKQLPKKESERRSHPLSRYSEVFSALETRYTLLSMTYKKYIDMNLCCFIPGRVLDIAFGIVNRINGYLTTKNIVQLDVIQILRDIRDYSSMAMEHFDEHIAPHYPNKSLISFSMTGSKGKPELAHCCAAIWRSKIPNTSNSDSEDNDEQIETLRQEMRNGLEEKNRVIDELRKEIAQQRNFMGQVVELLAQVAKRDEWNQTMMSALNKISSGCGISSFIIESASQVLNGKPSTSRSKKPIPEANVTNNSRAPKRDESQSVKSTISISSDGSESTTASGSQNSNRYTFRERKLGGYKSFAYPAQASAAVNVQNKSRKRKVLPEAYDFSLEMVKDAKQPRQ